MSKSQLNLLNLKDNESVKDLCLSLAYADRESEVKEILAKYNYWDDENSWTFYGGLENNFATIGNQASRPEGALVEKIINSVDAVLMAECLKRGINPESEQAPKSIEDALVKFFKIHDGKLSNIGATERSKLAENILLVSTGKKINPCYSVIDKGEGQTPIKMPETFLSLVKDNKLRIPFVQGKYNMGGTGVLRFCGKNNFQLIISKRYPDIIDKSDPFSNSWGFTIIRREAPRYKSKSSVYTYLAPEGKILSFKSDFLPLFPLDYPYGYGGKMEWGTYIKMYEYQMTGLKTNILFDLYNRLSLLLPTIALPIRFYERRKGYLGHSQETTLSGLTVRLEEDKRENLEPDFPSSSQLTVMGQNMKSSIFVFKKDQSKKYCDDEGIVFTINGQTHGYLSKSFFTRKNLRLGYIANSILVIVDCSKFENRSREELFMTSRDRLSNCELRFSITKKLEEMLKDHDGLVRLNMKRRQEEISDKLSNSKPLADILNSIIKKSPSLSKLLISGQRLSNPFKIEDEGKVKKFEGRKFPTYFTPIKRYDNKNPKNCHLGSSFRIQFKTDALNDYFERDSDPGMLKLYCNGSEVEDNFINLWQGTATLNVFLPHDAAMGDIYEYICEVTDVSRVEPFKENFFISVEKKIISPPGPGGPRTPPSGETNGVHPRKSGLDVPNMKEVYQNDWSNYNFDKESALLVIQTGEESMYDFFINMDNIYLLTEKKDITQLSPEIIDARYKYGMVLIGLALIRDYENSNEEDDSDISKKVLDFTKIISPFLLPMISSLGSLEVDDITVSTEEIF